MHPVFHASLMKPFEQAPDYQAPKPVKVKDGEREWELQAIVDHRTSRNKTQYLVHWKGYGPEWQSWLREEDLEGSPKLLREYLQKVQTNPEYGEVDDFNP